MSTNPSWHRRRELLKAYRSGKKTWEVYESDFRKLVEQRAVEKEDSRKLFTGRAALLCSEPTPDMCHRRLVVEYLAEKWGNVRAVHL